MGAGAKKVARSFEKRRQERLRLDRLMGEFLDAAHAQPPDTATMYDRGRGLRSYPSDELDAAEARWKRARAQSALDTPTATVNVLPQLTEGPTSTDPGSNHA
jgi:hypothetical protein